MLAIATINCHDKCQHSYARYPNKVAGIRRSEGSTQMPKLLPTPQLEALVHAANTLRTCAPEQRQTIINYINNILDWINSR